MSRRSRLERALHRQGRRLEADEIFLDLEDAVAPNEKDAARARVIEALSATDFGDKTVVVRVNGTDTPHYYRT